MKSFVITAVASVLVSSPALAAGNTASTSGTATATVIAPITLQHASGAALGFGKFTTGTGGAVTVSPSGAGSVSGDVTFVSGNTNSADAFAVTGEASRSFAITTTAGSVTKGSVSMPFTTVPSAAALTLGSTGTATFTVGGTLTIAGTETAGNYSGTYNATVTYN